MRKTRTKEIGKRRPVNVVIVALANKMARTIWAILAHERAYDSDHVSVPPHMAAPTMINLIYERMANVNGCVRCR